jgi:hypothetical protein
MLNYRDTNSTCANLLQTNGINIDRNDKNTLKGVSTMMGAKARYKDGMKNLNGCVISKEALPLLEASQIENRCIVGTYRLSATTDGTLPMDPILQKAQLDMGTAINPTGGCYHPINSSTDTSQFVKDVGQIVDSKNQQILFSMRKTLDSLKAECAQLDIDINTATGTLDSLRDVQIPTQSNFCISYIDGIINNGQIKIALQAELVVETDRKAKAEAEAKVAADGWTTKFMLRNPNKNNLCVDDGNRTRLDEVDKKFLLWNCDQNNPNQHFTYDPSTMQLRNPNKDQTLCVDDGGVTRAGENNINYYTCDPNNPNQKFKYDSSTNMFSTPNKNNLCMDDGGGTSAGQTKFWQWTCDTNNKNQQFERMELGTEPQAFKGNVVVVCKSKENIPNCVWAGGTKWDGSQNAYWISQFAPNLCSSKCTFTRDFNVSNSKQVKIYINSDNTSVIYMNGKEVGPNNNGWESTAILDAYVTAGKNTIKVNLTQGEGTTGPGGILLSIHEDSSGAEILVSDGSWTVV